MSLQPKIALKPFRKFRKILKSFPQPPAPADVHLLRTQARHLEVIVQALGLGAKTPGSSLLKNLKPIRKQAGDVRDMDVLVGLASSLQHNAGDEAVVRLLELLVARREKAAQRLCKSVAARKQKAGKHLRRCLGLVKDEIAHPHARHPQQEAIQPRALALQFQTELSKWPAFTAKNIHPYRLKVKELRYVLQLGQGSESEFSSALGAVKDQVGSWHDWSLLAVIARKHFNTGTSRKILKQIRARSKQEFDNALSLANALQAQYFSRKISPVARRKAPVREIGPKAIKAASRLAG